MTVASELGRAAEILRDADVVAAFVGAGLSAESGIPTFRGAGGLWNGHPVELVATPEGFRSDSVLVWQFYAGLQQAHSQVAPNAGHLAMAEMEVLFRDFLVISQNVDRLCEAAGSRNLIKIHGDLFQVWCTSCQWTGELDAPLVLGAEADIAGLPHCPACGSLARPGIVWFGEFLPAGALERSTEFVSRCDALLVVGTSGLVSGGYGLAQAAHMGGATVIEVNLEPTWLSEQADVCVLEPSGKALPDLVSLIKAGR